MLRWSSSEAYATAVYDEHIKRCEDKSSIQFWRAAYQYGVWTKAISSSCSPSGLKSCGLRGAGLLLYDKAAGKAVSALEAS